jgi:hypothetical protein
MALDIFDVLKQINKKNICYLDVMPSNDQKQFNTYLVYRWLSSTTDPLQLILISKYVDPYIATLNKHPLLLYKLMCITGSKHNIKYNFLKKNTSNKLRQQVISEYFGISTRAALRYLDLLSIDDIKEMAGDLGWQQDELKKI